MKPTLLHILQQKKSYNELKIMYGNYSDVCGIIKTLKDGEESTHQDGVYIAIRRSVNSVKKMLENSGYKVCDAKHYLIITKEDM